ncbi:MAG: hypothetical protein R3E88_19665 [Myxococcota bacterium]
MPTSADERAPSPPSSAVAGLALAAALSPVLVDLVRHAAANAFATPCLFFAVALVVAAARARREPPRAPALGLALAGVAGVAGALLAAADWPRFGRLALPLGVLGLAFRTGRPTPRAAVLAIWLVPLPHFVAALPSPVLERTWLSFADALVAPRGATSIRLVAEDAGLALAWWLAGAGYARALAVGAKPAHALRLCLGGAIAAFPFQLAAVAAALAIAASPRGGAVAAQTWLHVVVPIAVPALALVAAPLRPRR